LQKFIRHVFLSVSQYIDQAIGFQDRGSVPGNFRYLTLLQSGPGSSVGIATDYGLDGLVLNPDGDEIFRRSRQALVPTQPSVQWVPSLSQWYRRPGREAEPPPHLVPKALEKNRAIPLLTLRACVAYKKSVKTP